MFLYLTRNKQLASLLEDFLNVRQMRKEGIFMQNSCSSMFAGSNDLFCLPIAYTTSSFAPILSTLRNAKKVPAFFQMDLSWMFFKKHGRIESGESKTPALVQFMKLGPDPLSVLKSISLVNYLFPKMLIKIGYLSIFLGKIII